MFPPLASPWRAFFTIRDGLTLLSLLELHPNQKAIINQ